MNTKQDKLKPPKKDLANLTHDSFKQFLKLSTANIANPLIDFVLPSFHQKEIEKWRQEVYNRIIDLEKRHNHVTIENLRNNTEFTTLLIECVQIANKTSQAQKLDMLRNGLINSIFEEIDINLKYYFFRLLDILTINHIILLDYFDNYQEGLHLLTTYEFIYKTIKKHFEDFHFKKHDLKLYLKTLESNGLIRISDELEDYENEVYTIDSLAINSGNKNLPMILVLETGKDFLRFIKENNN